MAVPITTILNWFKTNLQPTEAQFKATLESFRHKNEKVPVADVEGIDDLISQKADADKLNSHIQDNSRHLTNELLTSLPTLITVFGNKFRLLKHPLNNEAVKQRTLENGDFILDGFFDSTTLWVKAQCLDVDNKEESASWNVLSSIEEINPQSTSGFSA